MDVEDHSLPKGARKKDWVLTQQAFRQFLFWLVEGDSGGEKYLEMHRRLVAYFDRKNCLAPDELADETLTRIARRLEEEGAITNTMPARYCYIVAKFVFLEYVRRSERRPVSLDEGPGAEPMGLRLAAGPEPEAVKETREKRLECLERCLQKLGRNSRDLILQYYRGHQKTKIENRRALAARLGLTVNALTLRACRIRNQLEACVRHCAAHE